MGGTWHRRFSGEGIECCRCVSGIFAYLNYLTPKSRREILEVLVNGLKRLEYRGYDSAGIAVDSASGDDMTIIKQSGKVAALENAIKGECANAGGGGGRGRNTADRNFSAGADIDFDGMRDIHVGIAHTRWATHGAPSIVNSHPQRSDSEHQFVVVHNGIVTNYKEVKTFLTQRGYQFESDTDTEVIAKLVHHIYLQNEKLSFREIVEQVIQQLVGITLSRGA